MDWINNYTLHRRRVKYAWVYVNYQLEVKIVIPLRYSQADLDSFIRLKSAWVAKKLEHYKKVREQVPALDQREILLFGEIVRPDIDTSSPQAVEKWYRHRAKQYFAERTAELAAQHGFTYNSISIRDAKTRWGSCSPKKNLTFNWRLLKAPKFVSDYLILHELSHTLVLNHSTRFWKLLAKVYPTYEEAKKWLKTYGSSL